MENITFVKYRSILAHYFSLIAVIFVFGSASSYGNTYVYNHGEKILHEVNVNDKSNIKQNSSNEFWDLFSIRSLDLSRTDIDYSGVYSSNSIHQISAIPLTLLDSSLASSIDSDGDGVTNDKENADGTDPNNSCDFILAHQNCTPSTAWKNADCDGDGVTNNKEKIDGTDPLDPCDFVLGHQNCSPSTEWKNADCDGDGVTNEKEKEDGTDPLDPCDFVLAHQNCSPSTEWKNADCDGDGVTNEKEKEDGTDPLDPCDFVLAHQNCSPSTEWKNADCDGDGVTNEDEKTDGTDPLDPCDYNPEHITLAQSGDYLTADCDGDGVTNEDEKEDGTDPLDSCDFVLAHQTVVPSNTWNDTDCDGDGVTNEDEKDDGTDPLDPCDYSPEHITLPQSGDYLTADCDGDGVTNENEKEDGTDPLDPCDFVLAHQTVAPSNTWNDTDCDGDGVTNEDEKEDGTDPLDPCDYNPESVTLTPSVDWEVLDCDNDGNPNGTDPDPLVATARDDSGSTPAMTEVAINILENDDYLPNNHPDNLGITALSMIGGSALGTVTFDEETGFLTYTPVESESNTTVTIIYQVCNLIPDPNVCASATVTIQVGPDMDNVIDAVDDSYSVDTGVSGVIPDSNVLGNDTINGEVVAATDVVLTSTPTDELTINEDGSVSVAPGTADGTYTIEYTICEAANTDNCDTGTVTVQVGPDMGNVIDAVDDSYSVDTDVSGVIPDSNVLGNDTINGEVVAAADIVLTSTPTDELTINEDGSVSVAPGTADGTYTIEYTICELANTDNCDTATVTIQVGPDMDNVIDAVDDSYSVDTDVSGVIPDSNVLGNDTINGEVVAAADIVLTSTPTDELTINEDGSVSVAPGSADGTYTIEYTICEVANTDNCDTGTVTVQVGPDMDNVIDAVDDSYSVDTGVSGVIPDSNVLGNDTINGEIVAATDVVITSTPTDELTINEDGSVSVAPGSADGTYTIEYTICEVANTDNCDTATVTIQVGPDMDNVIDAVDDSYSVDTGVSGVVPDSNVLGNDTINGEVVAAANVVLTSTPTDELTINEDGSISVAPGTADGTYTIEYNICEVANTDNCDTATVTIQVGPDMDNVIDAVDDSYSVDTDVSGVIPDSNVLGNDTINGEVVAATDVVLTSTPTDELTINEDGSVSVAPGSADGTYTIEYTICEAANTDNCDTGTVTVQVGPDMDNVIDAVDDSYSVDTDVSGVIPDSNVLGNDTINGEVVAATDVVLTSTPTDELTINEDGSVSVAPGTADGTYTIEYTICEVANTDNCDTATVTIQVGPDMDNVIDAVDDSYSVDTGVSGVIPDSKVLGNDTINGEIVAATDVVLTSTPTDELTINEDGSVSVAPGTADGTYTIEYTICEAANTDNCDTGTVTVQVGPEMNNVIVAVDDAYTTDTNNTGLITGSNVLDNDTLNGDPVASTDVVLTSTPTDVLTINEDGSVSVAPGTADGTYTIDYMICEAANAENCDTATVTVIIEEGDEDEKIEVNQLVTPNSDGKNDFLFIRGVRNANNNTLKIFNRWGVSVYEGKGYNNQNNVFDGRSKARSTVTGNNYLPAGVYYYIFQYENKQQNITDSGYIYVSK